MDIDKEIATWTAQLNQGGRDVFQKAFNWNLVDTLVDAEIYPYFLPIEENQGPVARFRGQEVIMLGSNNYLGLTTHPHVREESINAIKKYGTGMTGSRFLNGTLEIHHQLEDKIAKFLGKEAALVFTTGYQANLGVLTAMINDKSVAIVDKSAHASIHDGCKLMDGEAIRFAHNDLDDLKRILDQLKPDQGAMILVDGVYSMEGDLAPLPEMVKLAKEYNVRIVVDDAHGFGVVGPGGRGTSHHFGLENEVDLIVGTFSKSFASTGGFVAGPRKIVNFIKHFGRPMIFSASLTPSCTAAASAALDVLIKEPERASQVCTNARYMKSELAKMGFKTGHTDAAIVPVIIGDNMKTFFVWKELLEKNVYTNPVVYPAVAKGTEMLRTSYLSTHKKEHLDRALAVFKDVGKMFELI